MDRTMLIDHLAKAELHIAQSTQHIERQHQLIAELQRDGHDTESALELLASFEQTHANHLADRDRIRAEIEAAS